MIVGLIARDCPDVSLVIGDIVMSPAFAYKGMASVVHVYTCILLLVCDQGYTHVFIHLHRVRLFYLVCPAFQLLFLSCPFPLSAFWYVHFQTQRSTRKKCIGPRTPGPRYTLAELVLPLVSHFQTGHTSRWTDTISLL